MKYIILFILFFLQIIDLQAQKIIFTSIDSVFAFAKKNAIIFQTSKEQISAAQYQTLMSKINALNPKASVTGSLTDNLQLPVSFIPAEIFGGPVGAFRQAQFGQQFISNLGVNAQIDLVNLQNWDKVKSNQTQESIQKINASINQKTLYESLSATYFNVLSIQKHIEIIDSNLINSKLVLNIVEEKQKQGLVRIQDVNQAQVNVLQLEEKKIQLVKNKLLQINVLKILCDLPFDSEIEISENRNELTLNLMLESKNTLLSQQNKLQIQFAKQELKSFNKSFYPTLSFVANWTYQSNSNEGFFHTKSSSFPVSYLSLRLNYFIPDANKFAQKRSIQSQLYLSQLNSKHIQNQELIQNKQMDIEANKAFESLQINKKITFLKKDTFYKNLNIYEQNLISMDFLILSLNEKINAELNEKVNEINLQYLQNKIVISNSIQQ